MIRDISIDFILVIRNAALPFINFNICFINSNIECEKEIILDRILYIESKLHKLEFHVIEKGLVIYSMYGTLNELEKICREWVF